MQYKNNKALNIHKNRKMQQTANNKIHEYEFAKAQYDNKFIFYYL
jgi:hypothetical protein